jgi:hypothetical protein
VLLASRWPSSGGGDEGAAVVASKRSRRKGGGDGEGVPTRQWRRRWGPGGGGDDGVLAVAACALVASLAVRLRQRVKGMKFCKVF